MVEKTNATARRRRTVTRGGPSRRRSARASAARAAGCRHERDVRDDGAEDATRRTAAPRAARRQRGTAGRRRRRCRGRASGRSRARAMRGTTRRPTAPSGASSASASGRAVRPLDQPTTADREERSTRDASATRAGSASRRGAARGAGRAGASALAGPSSRRGSDRLATAGRPLRRGGRRSREDVAEVDADRALGEPGAPQAGADQRGRAAARTRRGARPGTRAARAACARGRRRCGSPRGAASRPACGARSRRGASACTRASASRHAREQRVDVHRRQREDPAGPQRGVDRAQVERRDRAGARSTSHIVTTS